MTLHSGERVSIIEYRETFDEEPLWSGVALPGYHPYLARKKSSSSCLIGMFCLWADPDKLY